jgi:CRP/FNR family transcriptional regulator, anaerobic regulatory protein
MDTHHLFQILNSVNILSADLRAKLNEIIIEERFCKKHILLKEGMVAQRIYFIKKGFVRAYYKRYDQQFTSWFMGEGEIIISVYSFFSRKPSSENIEVLDDCVLQSINWTQLQDLYSEFPPFNITGRIITEQYYIRSEERSIILQTLPAKQRYEKLLLDYPLITQHATLGQIATYLGIKQETLSRIRAVK